MTIIIQSRADLDRLLVTMHAEGWSIRALSKHFSVSRNLVRRVLRKQGEQREQGHDIGRAQRITRTSQAGKLEPFIPKIKALLEGFPKITGQRVYEELQADGYDGGITILRDRLLQLRPAPKKEPVVRFETEPGRQGQMDWSPYTIDFTRTGKATVNCFSYVLGFSRRQFIAFTPQRRFHTLIRRHQDSFAWFNGVPRQCLYDNEKTVVLRWEAGQPVYNPAFSAFITHYQCRPIACKPRRPETKGKVERSLYYVEQNLLGGRTFRDLEDLQTCADWWMRNRADSHIHSSTGRPPLELFLEQEQEALLPLPRHPYDSAEVALRVCNIEGYLEFETNYYPVPYEYVTDILTLKATDNEVLVYAPDLSLLVSHPRLPLGAANTLDADGIHGPRANRYGLEPVREQFLALGDDAETFLRGLKGKHPKNCGFHVRSILREKEAYNSDDINKAIAHACRYHAYDHDTVARILKAKAAPRTLESQRNSKAEAELRQALPQINQRSLAEYQSLIGEKAHEEESPHPISGADQNQPENPET